MSKDYTIDLLRSYKILGLYVQDEGDIIQIGFPLVRERQKTEDKKAIRKACSFVIKTFFKHPRKVRGYDIIAVPFLHTYHTCVNIHKQKMNKELLALLTLSKQQFYDCVIIPLIKNLEEILKEREFISPSFYTNGNEGIDKYNNIDNVIINIEVMK